MKNLFFTFTLLYGPVIYRFDFFAQGTAETEKAHVWTKGNELQWDNFTHTNETALAGVIVSDNNENNENIFSAVAVGQGASVAAGAIKANGSVSGSGHFSYEDSAGTATGEVHGSGVVSIATGSGAAYSINENGTVDSFSTGSENGDTSVGVSVNGEGTADVAVNTTGTNLTVNKISIKKSKTAMATAVGAATSTTISSDEASVVGTSSTNNSTASGSVKKHTGTGNALASISTKGSKGGSAASGSVSGGSAITSLSGSYDDYDDYSSSISAISTRMFPYQKRFRKLRRRPLSRYTSRMEQFSPLFYGKPTFRFYSMY